MRSVAATILVGALLATAIGGCSGTRGEAPTVQQRGETADPGNFPEQTPWKELKVTPPAYPRERDLIEFELTGQTANRFYIDGTSLTVESDKVVRFVLVIRSAGGASTISFSGVHCDTGQWKDYAFGRSGSWEINSNAQWRRIRAQSVNNYQDTLRSEFFCFGGIFSGGVQGTAKDIVRTLKDPTPPDPRVPGRRL